MKKYLGLVLVLFLASCKTKAVLAEGKADDVLSAEKIIQNHYTNNKVNFSTLYIKSSAHYEDSKQAQSVTAEIKIKKDEKILVSVRFLGITMAKALITPQSVQYYEKINGTYFEGDYAGLSKWLGADLDFNKVQNLLIGQAIDDLNKGKYSVSILDKLYKLEDSKNTSLTKLYFFESNNFLIKKEEISQAQQQRSLQIMYPDYKKYEEMILPLSMEINANQNESKTKINIEYKTVTFNENFSFPYSVPEGYERIYIDKN